VQGSDIYGIMKHAGVTHLHYADSVLTSCTFLEQGAILSRGYVEATDSNSLANLR